MSLTGARDGLVRMVSAIVAAVAEHVEVDATLAVGAPELAGRAPMSVRSRQGAVDWTDLGAIGSVVDGTVIPAGRDHQDEYQEPAAAAAPNHFHAAAPKSIKD